MKTNLLNGDFFNNENILKFFRKNNLDELRNSIELWSYELPENISNFIKNKIAITCYWSDSRLDRSNDSESSVDLLICNTSNKSVELIQFLIKKLVEKTNGLTYDNSYLENFNEETWEELRVEDEINIWSDISKIQINNQYIDILNLGDDLYKYKWKYFPDRLIDSYFIWWNPEILNDFKVGVMNGIIVSWDNKKSIFWKFKKNIKNYFNEYYIKWKNHRNWDDIFNLEKWIIRFDWENCFWFKHWPLRALQYKLIERFIQYSIDEKDPEIIKDLPFDVNWRLNFLNENSCLDGLSEIEMCDLYNIYTKFKNFNLDLEMAFKYDVNSNTFKKWGKNWEFFINSNDLNIIKLDLEKFIELFNKL